MIFENLSIQLGDHQVESRKRNGQPAKSLTAAVSHTQGDEAKTATHGQDDLKYKLRLSSYQRTALSCIR
jgi:hypothetical protein